MKKTKTLKIRVRDKHRAKLSRMAKSVNFVWNYVNELSQRNIREQGRFLSAYDLQSYTKGANVELELHSQTVQMVCREYATRRKQFGKSKLKWRKSFGSNKSLGWVPLCGQSIQFKDGQVFHGGEYFKVWDSYGLDKHSFRAGSFSQDARGRWYFNVCVSVDVEQGFGKSSVGIDLGCKETATDSNGTVVHGREYRRLEEKLGIAQRARNKARVRAIHAKIKSRRTDALHKYSRKLVNENAAIFVGDVSSKKLVKTRMAKSVLDAGWGQLKTMLEYKCNHAGIIFEVVNEAYTTVTCSVCKNRTGPTGLEGLRIRRWECECGVTHDRDINSAINIAAAGHRRLTVGNQEVTGGCQQ